jgi:hypothetical protein
MPKRPAFGSRKDVWPCPITARARLRRGDRANQVLDLALGEEVHLALGGARQLHSVARVRGESFGANGGGNNQPENLAGRTHGPWRGAGRRHVREQSFDCRVVYPGYLQPPNAGTR